MFSLEQHYREHSEQIYQFIYFLTFDRALAEDLMQETFIKAHAAQHTYRGDANVLTWLRVIAKNTTYDHLKKKTIRYFLPFAQLPDSTDVAISAAELVHLQDDKRELYAAISKLKPDFRVAIVLRKIEELSIKETALILGWNESKVKNNTERGMKALQEMMKGGSEHG